MGMSDEQVLQMAEIEPQCLLGFMCVKCGEHCDRRICERCRIKARMRLRGFDIHFIKRPVQIPPPVL